MWRIATITLGIAALVCLSTVGTVTAGDDEPAARSYLWIAKTEALPQGLAKSIEKAGGTLVRSVPDIGVAVVESDASDFVSKAKRITGARSVVANFWVPGPAVESRRMGKSEASGGGDYDPGDTFFADQWALRAIEAPEAWDEGAEGKGVVVAVLDDGFSKTHPDLKDNLLASYGKSFAYDGDGNLEDWNCETDPAAPGWWFSHGSHCAGIIAAAANDYGIVGVAPQAKILPVQVLSRNLGYGMWDWMIDGIVYAADNGADVINMSLAGYVYRNGYYDEYEEKWYSAKEVAEALVAIRRALTYAHNKGVVIVAALSNESLDLDKDKCGIVAPAELSHVIAVSATGPIGIYYDPLTDLDEPAVYTNYGQSAVDLAAPGGNADVTFPFGWWYDLVLSTIRYDPTGPEEWNYGWAAGTSMAAPHVAGVAALIIGESEGDLTPAQVEAILGKTADDLGKPGNDDWYGRGRVNAYQAVK